jgi:hypothetical protein
MRTTERPLLTVATRHVANSLTPEQLGQVMRELREKMKVQDPDNPDLWTVNVDKFTLWGILDHGAGPEGENVLTVLFPEDY